MQIGPLRRRSRGFGCVAGRSEAAVRAKTYHAPCGRGRCLGAAPRGCRVCCAVASLLAGRAQVPCEGFRVHFVQPVRGVPRFRKPRPVHILHSARPCFRGCKTARVAACGWWMTSEAQLRKRPRKPPGPSRLGPAPPAARSRRASDTGTPRLASMMPQEPRLEDQ